MWTCEIDGSSSFSVGLGTDLKKGNKQECLKAVELKEDVRRAV